MRILMTPSTAKNEQKVRLNWMKSSTASKLRVNSSRFETKSWKTMATAGTSCFDLRENRRSMRYVLTHCHGHARADPGHGADRGDEPEANYCADDVAAELAEHVLAGDDGDVKLSGQFARRRRGEEDGIEADVERR